MVIVWDNAAASALTILRAEIPERPEPYTTGVTITAHVPADKDIGSASPLILVRPDSPTVSRVVNQRAPVRITCWHTTEYQAIQLCALAQGILMAHRGESIRSVEYVSGPVPGIDTEANNVPLATCTVACHMRPRAV